MDSLSAPRGSECTPSPTWAATLDHVIRKQHEQPKHYQAQQSDMKNFYPADYPMRVESVKTGQVRAHPLVLRDKPFIVLMTPGKAPPGERGERLRAGRTAAAEKLVAASTRGKLVKFTSGYYIHDEHPDGVIGEVIDEARGSSNN